MKKSELGLRQLLNLSDEEIENSKLALCGYEEEEGDYWYNIWKNSNETKVSFAYLNSEKRHNYVPGQVVFGFAQIPENNKKWVLITVGKVLTSPDGKAICEYEPIEKYNGMLGRLYIELATGYRFIKTTTLSRYIDQAKVISIDDVSKNIIEFKGFNQVCLNYDELCLILSNENSDYYKILNNIKGIYCLTDRKTGKLYIGSAYGRNGIASRWKDYMITLDGGNKELIRLRKDNNEEYIKKNFTFTLLEFFGMNVSDSSVIEREKYWKKVFNTVENGLNDN